MRNSKKIILDWFTAVELRDFVMLEPFLDEMVQFKDLDKTLYVGRSWVAKKIEELFLSQPGSIVVHTFAQDDLTVFSETNIDNQTYLWRFVLTTDEKIYSINLLPC